MTDAEKAAMVKDIERLHGLTMMNLNRMDATIAKNSSDVIEGYDSFEQAKLDMLGMFQKMINSIHNFQPDNLLKLKGLMDETVLGPPDDFNPNTATEEESRAHFEKMEKERNDRVRKELDEKPFGQRVGMFPGGENIE